MVLVVTGSTDGIGKEYAKQLAQRGINIVLIARNESKLIDVSKEIGIHITSSTKYLFKFFHKIRTQLISFCNLLVESLYAVQTKYIVADFSHGKEIYDRIEPQLQKLSVPIGILGKKLFIKCKRNTKNVYVLFLFLRLLCTLPNVVNNVGIFYDYPEEFAKVSSDTVWSMVMTNITAMTMMTRIIINKMKERKKGVLS